MAVPRQPTVHSAVLPAGVPDRATDFFGLGRVDGVSLIGMLRSFFVCDPVILRLSAGRLSASRRHRRWQCRRWMPRHRHANAPVGSGQNGMARTMGLLSRPAGRLPPPRRLQAPIAPLLLPPPFLPILLVGVVVEEI